jgi:NADH-quinone oxidoreductase subunit L
MILVVTGVGSLIHIYSVGYMAHDEERVRYFSYLNLFTFFMLLLVLGGSLPLLFVGWEGVGLCSYLLIGFWFKRKSATDAGMKAFVVNRIGDAGLILGMILAFHAFGTLDLVDLATNAASMAPEEGAGVVTAVCLLLFVGACGKSAQIPLHVWLPDAMEGPTPVSALIHAATMVTAGVYMVARLAPLYALSETAMAVVAIVGTATAVMGATIALVQNDIKKVLAYSTVSQLGYMFLAAGVGAFGVAVFHLFTHAFFKALLFLGSGSVIHALSGEQDMRKMGGLARRIPWTFGTFVIGTLAIAGIPPLAGYFSKDAILAGAHAAHWNVLFGLGLLTALLTAFYMGRLLFPPSSARTGGTRRRRNTSTSRRRRWWGRWCCWPSAASWPVSPGSRSTWNPSCGWATRRSSRTRRGCPGWPPAWPWPGSPPRTTSSVSTATPPTAWARACAGPRVCSSGSGTSTPSTTGSPRAAWWAGPSGCSGAAWTWPSSTAS